jgi:hypothetical protein
MLKTVQRAGFRACYLKRNDAHAPDGLPLAARAMREDKAFRACLADAHAKSREHVVGVADNAVERRFELFYAQISQSH